MTELSQTKLKAGVLAGALRMPASTIRSLVGAGLILGQRAGPGHPDYTLADVVRLKLLELLRSQYLMDGPRSIAVVNAFNAHIDEAVLDYERERTEFQSMLFISSRFGAGGDNGFPPCEVVKNHHELLSLIDREGRSGSGYTVVPLSGPVVGARYGLGKVLYGDWEVRN